MSTKIYNGILIDIDDIWSVEEKIRKSLSKTFDERNEEITNDYIMSVYNDALYDNLIKDKSIMPSPFELTADAIIKLQKHRQDPNFRESLEAKVIIYPPLNGHNKLMGVVIAEDYIFRENLLNLPFIQDYSYWNNSDKPEHLTGKEWKERRKNWDRVFENSGSPMFLSSGICIELGRTLETFQLKTRADTFLYNGNYNFATLQEINRSIISRMVMKKIGNFSNLTKDIVNTFLQVNRYVNNKIHDVQDMNELPIFELPLLSEEDMKKGAKLSLPRIDYELLEEWVEEVNNKIINDSNK